MGEFANTSLDTLRKSIDEGARYRKVGDVHQPNKGYPRETTGRRAQTAGSLGCCATGQCPPEGRSLYQVVSSPFQYSGIYTHVASSVRVLRVILFFPRIRTMRSRPDAEYWRDLGQSSAFEDQILIDCIHRLHEDILKVWNFNDPTGVSH